MKSWNFGIVILAPSKFHDVEIPSFLQKSWNREFEAQTRKLGIVILALKFCPPLLRIPKFPIPLPAPSAPCKPRIPKFPIPLPAPSAPCKPSIPKFPIPLPAPSAPLQTRYTYTFNLGSDTNFQSRPQGPQRPKAKRFRIPRREGGRLKLHFPPCNVTQPRGAQ